MTQNAEEINSRFQLSWERLAKVVEKDRVSNNKTDRAIIRLERCLKWCLAYTHLRDYCGGIIMPFSEQYIVIIKKFWVQYFEQYFLTDIPPIPQDFFEWYCDSETIEEERKLNEKIKECDAI